MNFSFRDLLREATQPATLRAIPFILFGCFVAAVALVYFINPYGIVPGGAFGASIVIHAIFPSMPIGTLGLMIQIPLMLISMLVLGGRLGVRTIVAAISLPLFVNLLTALSYPAGEAMRTLDPKLLLGGHLDLTNDLIVSSLIGGVLLGAGTGLVIRQQASSGGSDIVAMILNKYSGMPFSYCLMIVDGTIVLSGLLVIGMGLGLNVGSAEPRSWMLSFYSLITMFAEQEKEIWLLVVRQKELPAITAGVKELAPDCFVVVTDAYDAYGYRWKALPDAGALQIH